MDSENKIIDITDALLTKYWNKSMFILNNGPNVDNAGHYEFIRYIDKLKDPGNTKQWPNVDQIMALILGMAMLTIFSICRSLDTL